jgi:hypothetical protein
LASHKHERALADIIKGEKIELKSETWQWEQTGNICIEYACAGIATTEADIWVHELRRDGSTLVYLWFRLKELARDYYRRGCYRTGVGDDGRFSVVLIPLKGILR